MKNTYFGFTNGLKPMQAAKVEKSLDMLVRFTHDDKEIVRTEKEFVYLKLQSGCKPEIEENYSYYSRKLDDYTKPKTLYKLVHTDGSTFNEINKTSYNYALHLLENDLLHEQKAAAFIEKEKKEKDEAERLELERVQKEREEKQRQKEIEDKKSREQSERKQKQWLAIGELLLQNFEIDPIKVVLDRNWEELMNLYSQFEGDRETTYEQMVKKYTMMIGNQGLCSHRLQYFVENENNPDKYEFTIGNNPTMTLEKEILFEAFKIELTDKNTTITAKVKAVFEGREYKGSKPITFETFYYIQGNRFIKCEGQPLHIEGMEFFIRQDGEVYRVYEATSGRGVNHHTSRSEAIKKAKEVVKTRQDLVQSQVEQAIKKDGLSPRYQIEEIKNENLPVHEIQFNEAGQGVLF